MKAVICMTQDLVNFFFAYVAGVAGSKNVPSESDVVSLIPSSETASNELTLSSTNTTEISVTALNIVVHFNYGTYEFARRIAAATITEFYSKVISILEKKTPGSKPNSVQFQCGTKWYKLTEHTDFDSLCLNENNPEITIQAIPILVKSGVCVCVCVRACVRTCVRVCKCLHLVFIECLRSCNELFAFECIVLNYIVPFIPFMLQCMYLL